jgi:hypothetical protein
MVEENIEAEEVGAGMELQFDYLLVADGAQVVGGKLYVLGGGWDRIQFPSYPQSLQAALAFGVRVPWRETNRRHKFVIRGTTADGDKQLFEVQGEFETGRPPGMPRGMAQLFQAAVSMPTLQVPEAGHYTIEATIDDGKARRTFPYYAVQIPG